MDQSISNLKMIPLAVLVMVLVSLAWGGSSHAGMLGAVEAPVQKPQTDGNKDPNGNHQTDGNKKDDAIKKTDAVDASQHAQNSEPESYDPLNVSKYQVKSLDLEVHDSNRDRKIPIRVYLPEDSFAAPVILFSHGLGGTRETCRYLAEHWVRRGYVCVFLQHPGSDDSVWKDERPLRRMAALKKAANNENFQRRAADVPAVLDQLEIWNLQKEHSLFNRMDLKHVGMSGHSFGAITTQAVSGQTFLGAPRFRDDRIQASIAFSPSSPRISDRKKAFSSIAIPWMSMTGTKDVAAIGGADVQSRLDVFENLPSGNKYQLVLHDGQHSAFTEISRRGSVKKNPNHHRLIIAFSTAFWDAWLRDDTQARQWLDSDACEMLLEETDEWSRK